MTNWRELPAGRELDRVVAEASGASGETPHYSTDLNAAVTLADAYFTIATRRGEDDEIIWEVWSALDDTGYASNSSLALAIVQGYLAYEESLEAHR